MKRTTRKAVFKSAPNVTGKQVKDYKTTPGSPGTNMKEPMTMQDRPKSWVKMAQAFTDFIKTR